jgi:hypothetical protein
VRKLNKVFLCITIPFSPLEIKKLLLILLCFPFIGFGQSWKHWSGGNAFDGNSRGSYVVGSGSDSPE